MEKLCGDILDRYHSVQFGVNSPCGFREKGVVWADRQTEGGRQCHLKRDIVDTDINPLHSIWKKNYVLRMHGRRAP